MEDLNVAQFLVKEGVVTRENAQKAIEMQKTIGGTLGQIMVKLGFLTDQQLSSAVARAEGMEYEDVSDLVLPLALINTVPRDIIEKHQVLPIHRDDETITLAVSDPLDFESIDEIQFLTGKKIHTVMASKDQIRKSISNFYHDDTTSKMLGEPSPSGDGAASSKLVDALVSLLIEKGVISEKDLIDRARGS